ncbi:efflux RND transporter permease subunit [Priestia flexa]|uniref:efflux RND transporter permease subunit n=1 Tax=Priestia flexa TaxID=86664 RepID=UPI00077C2611|nr:efflux RND transporter permease subunit [Priestia flexa]MED4587234.1 efflux RND transporter permease subunit [Priestia flexa]
MKIVKLSVLRPVAMSMVLVLLLILGGVSGRNMPVDLFPELTFPVAAVTATYDGAGPKEIENLLAEPLESSMSTLPNVESVRSVSQNGGVLVLVSFTWGTDMNFATLNMRERIDMAREALPEGASLPRVMRFDPSDLPIVQLSLTSENEQILEDLKQIAEEDIKAALDGADGVASVTVSGGAEKEILLTLDQQKMASYNLTLQDLQQIIGSENLNLPAGNVQDQNQNLPIRITGQFTSIEDIKELPIPTQSGVIKLENLAEIKEAYADADQLSYLNGKEAVGISVLKQSGANTVSVANEIDDRLKELNQTLPEGVKIDTILDQSDFINQSIKSVTSNMIIGSILASIILYLFLRNLRSTIIIGLAIPLSIVTTFVFMYFSGQTLNLLTLGGLALGIGMMVDNAIVILENIFRLRKQGLSKKDAAIKGTNQVGTAIIASTLTTVVVFLPIVFVDGLAAQLFKPLALVISFSLLASLFTALIIVPLFSSLFLKLATREKEQSNTDGKLFGKVKHFYKRRLDTALRHPKKTVGAVLLLFALSFAGIPFIGTEFLPAQDQSTVSVTAKLPQGTALEATYEKTEEINEILKDIPEVDLSSVTVGGSNNFSGSAGSNTNQATYNILLKPVDERDRSDKEIADEIRNKLNDIPSVDATVSSSEGGFTGDPISLEISGPDLDELVRISDQTVDILSEIDGVREPESSYNDGNPEVVISINRDKASQYGIGSAQISSTISEATQGVVASQLARDGEELNVRLLIDRKDTASTSDLENLLIKSPTGTTVPLKAVADISRGQGPSQITREDRLREIRVTADIIGRDLGSITDDIEKQLKSEISLPNKQYKIVFGGQNEQMNDAFYKLSLALALAVVLVYMVMAGQFESFLYPFIIMLSVPLTFIGIISGLLITNQPLGVGSLIGILILTGIVVNNAIVLVDYLQQLRKEGYELKEAILLAGPTRLRPILMTTLTTIIGLIPLTLGIGEGTELQQPMAIVIVFGLSFATIITLIFIPVIYYLVEKRKLKKKAKKEQKLIEES